MKRKMIGAAAAYMSGSFFASFFNDVRAWLIGAAAVAMVLIFGRKRGWKRTDSLLLGIAFTVGIVLYSSYTAASYKPVVAYDGTDGSFTGSITEITRYDSNRAGYVLKGRINGVTDAKITYFGYDPDARYGDTVSIEKCTFRKPSNDYIFNSELYYKADGIFLSAASAENVRITHTHTRFIRNKLADFRSYMTERLKAETDEDVGGFLAGMIFGEKRELDSDIKTSLYRSGIGHILAVSGLHVSIIALLLMSVLKKANVNRFVSYGIMNVMLISFVAMANYPVSAIRAAIMMDLFHGARLIRRQNNSLNSLAIASLIILTSQPYAIFDAGFLLSVSGTFGIAVFAPFMTKNMKYETIPQIIAKDLITALCTSVSVFPISMIFFDETSMISPAANVLLVPLCTISMINGLIFVITGGVLPILYPAKIFTGFVIAVSRRLADVRLFHLPHGSDFTAQLLVFLGSAVLGVYFIAHSRKAVAVSAALAAAIYGLTAASLMHIHRNELTVAVVGKGKNAAAVVTYHGTADVIDLTGHYKNPRYVQRYLTVNGYDNVSHLVLTKKAEERYQSYLDEFGFISISEKMFMADGDEVRDGGVYLFDKDGFSIERDAYTITYSSGVLTVSGMGGDVTFLTAQANIPETSSYTIRCGSKAESIAVPSGVNDIMLDDHNNCFEMILSENGSSIRSL